MSFKENARESKGPHADCHHNFNSWRRLLESNSDLVKLFFSQGHRVSEFFRDSAAEKSHLVLAPAFVDNSGKRHPPKLDLHDLRDERGGLNPICCQIAFDKAGNRCCANLDFQQSSEDFKKQARYLIRVDM